MIVQQATETTSLRLRNPRRTTNGALSTTEHANNNAVLADVSNSSVLRINNEKPTQELQTKDGDNKNKSSSSSTSTANTTSSSSSSLTTTTTMTTAKTKATPTWSSGVVFYPPSHQYWRIGNQWYDLSKFDHPGGSRVLLLARDRFEDATFVFEAHHHNYAKARAILRKYLVPSETVQVAERPRRQETSTAFNNNSRQLQLPAATHHDTALDANLHPHLLDDNAFYSVLRRRVTSYLNQVNCPGGGPTTLCLVLFGLVFFTWATCFYVMYQTGSFAAAIVTGLVGAVLGSFGHNWVHQPYYKERGFAILSLDMVGFSSEAWYREHVLQHHMYTNTPFDNHFQGTAPFLVTDPTIPRNFLQQYITPLIHPILLCFGTHVNYLIHTLFLLQGQEAWSIGKVIFPLQHWLMYCKWQTTGLALMFCMNAVTSVFYFTNALMNHNAAHTLQVQERNQSKDWGHAQLLSSADWCVDWGFLPSMLFLWLNYHTVHHLFPKIDYSHHPAIQKILIQTCHEFGVPYTVGHPVTIWKEMVQSFATPRSLMQEIVVYAGGL